MTRATANPVCLCMALSIAAVAPAFAQSDQETSARLEALFGAHEPYEAFLARLKDAVSAEDKRAVAAMIAYPLETRIAGKPATFGSEEDLVRRYDRLFTPSVVAAVEGQTYATLFATAEGVMVGDGEIWFSGICGDETCSEVSVKIIAINPPEEAPGGRAGADSGNRS
jgi:hypothetical protein